jgi:hypothetical protein
LAELVSAKFDSAIVLTGQKRTIGFCQFKEYKNSQNCHYFWPDIPFFATFEKKISFFSWLS